MENINISCKICNESLFSVDAFFHHNEFTHSEAVEITCPFENCLRFFSNRKSIRNHISSHFKFKLETTTVINESENKSVSKNVCSLDLASSDNNQSLSESISELKMKLLRQILHLLSDENISKTRSFEILRQSFENYSTLFQKLVQSGCLLQSQNICFQNLNEFFSEAPNVLKSEYRLRKTLIDAGYYVESRDCKISSEKKLIFVNGLPNMIDDDIIVKLFNNAEILKKFFNLPNVTRDIVNFVDKLYKDCDGPIYNIIQSKLWKWHLSLSNETPSILHLPIFLYFDDFEPLNALGSHSGAYKIGASYLGLPFLPNDIVSKLKFILPIALFFSEDRKRFGNEVIFAPVVK